MIPETPTLQRKVSSGEERYTNLIKNEFVKHAKEINKLNTSLSEIVDSLPKSDMSGYYTKQQTDDKIHEVVEQEIQDIGGSSSSPTKVSELLNDMGYLTYVTWNDIENKPSTYPPSSHSHSWNSIQNKPNTYPPSYHEHQQYLTEVQWDDINSKPSKFPPSSHTHIWEDITDKPTFANVATTGSYIDLYNKPTKLSEFSNDTGFITSIDWEDVLNKPQTFPPSTHTHQDYLPLSGGTMTGSIMFTGLNDRSAGIDLNNDGKNFDIGWNYNNRDGGGFYLRSTDFSTTTGGGFGAYARNATNSYDLFGNPNGALTWAGTSFTVGGGTGTITGNITGNVLTGYAKPSSTSALATTDTLNGALGKLEKALEGKSNTSHTHSYLPLAGGTMTGKISKAGVGKGWNVGRDTALVATTSISGYSPFSSVKTTNGSWDTGAYDSTNYTDQLIFSYVPDTLYSGTNATPTQIKFDSNGDIITVGQLVINRNNSPAGGGIKLTGAGQNYAMSVLNTNVTKGTAPSSTQFWGIDFYGKDADSYNKRIGMLETTLNANNVATTAIRAYNCTTNTNTNTCTISVNVDGSGNAYTSAPTPATADNSTKIATTAFVKNQGYITSSGTATNVSGTVAIANGGTGATTRLNAIKALTNENVGTNATHFLGLKSDWSKVGYVSVADAKTVLGLGSAAYTASTAYAAASHTHSYLPLSGGTLTGNVLISKAKPVVYLKDTGITRGTAPSAANNQISMYLQDSGGHTVWGIYSRYGTDKSNRVDLIAYKGTTTDSAWSGIGVGYDASGNWFTYAPTPAQTNDSTNIATTAYVKDCVPKSIGSATQPVYTNANGVVTACTYELEKSVPSNAVFTDTHWTSHLYVGSGTAANAATTNGNTKIVNTDNSTVRNTITIKGTNATTVTSDANGVITINSVNTNNISATGTNHIRFNNNRQICWGSVDVNSGNNNKTVTFSAAFSASPSFVMYSNNNSAYYGSLSSTSVKVYGSTDGGTINWVAVGSWS